MLVITCKQNIDVLNGKARFFTTCVDIAQTKI